MAVLNEIKNGADLTKPKPQLGWIAGALVSAALLIGVFIVVMFTIGKGKKVVPGASTVIEGARTYMS